MSYPLMACGAIVTTLLCHTLHHSDNNNGSSNSREHKIFPTNYFIFWPSRAAGLWDPTCNPLRWKCGFLTFGPPGKSCYCSQYFTSVNSFDLHINSTKEVVFNPHPTFENTGSCSGKQGPAQYIFNPTVCWWVGLGSLPVVV